MPDGILTDSVRQKPEKSSSSPAEAIRTQAKQKNSPSLNTMKSLHLFLTPLLGLCALTSCVLPKNHSQVMHGNVRGGDVPLYMTGSMDDFLGADLILPDFGGYVRLEYDVFDLGKDGLLSPALKAAASPMAQIAIPRLISSFNLDDGFEIRHALPVDDTPSTSFGYALNDLNTSQAASATDTSSISHRSRKSGIDCNSFLQISAIP
jgi:hypothetical protein